jgi:hypothetical protein
MLLRALISIMLAASSVAGQKTPDPGAPNAKSDPQQAPVAARLVCPPAGQATMQDPAVFTWTKGSQTPNYRLLLGPAMGSSRDGDSSLITGLQGQLAGLPAGQNLYVTLWSYDQDGNAVQPPSYCSIKTAPQQGVVAFKDVPGTALSGVSLGSFAVTASPANTLVQAAQACQAQCKQNAGCQGYTYYPPGNGNPTAMCDLKSQITESQPNECCLSGLKTVTNAVPPAAAPLSAPVQTSVRAPAAAPVPPPPQAQTPVRAAAPAVKLVAGDWVNQFGAISRIVQQGNTISGTYSDAKQPSLSGTFQGTFDGQVLRATLKWKSGPDNSSGSLLLTLTPQGRLEGTWTDAAGVSGPWSMGPAGGAR